MQLNKINIKHYNKIKNKVYFIIILRKLRFLLIINFIQILSTYQQLFNKNFSKITLKVKGIGFNNILGRALGYLIEAGDCSFKNTNYPNEIYINGIGQKIINYSYYFNETFNLIELIWNNNIKDCSCMFHGCFNITEIDLSYFNSSELTNMYRMFFYCSSLTSINLNNFNTSIVTNMRSLFSLCSSLISLNLSNFDTSQVVYMNHMFSDCSSLISLDLSNFNTSNIKDLRALVQNCISLTSLNLSNFDISKVTWINRMFSGCTNLEYINLKNFKENNLSSYANIFNTVIENVVVCIEINNQSKIFSQLLNKKCLTIDCSYNWKLNQKKIINESGLCIDNCENDLQNKYEYNSKCYNNCLNGIFEKNKCKCELDKCLICPQVALNYELCSKCNFNYYKKENDELNIGEYFNCYKNVKGYYLDKDNSIFKKCYYTCKECERKGDNKYHNCLKCNEEFPIGFNFNNYTNCFKDCVYYYFFDEENNYHCTLNNSCPKEFPKLLKNKNECIKNDINNLMQEIIKFEKNETKEDNTEQKKEEEVKYYDAVIENIEKAFTENYNTNNLDSGKDDMIETEKMKITFTTTDNQKNNKNDNETKINLGKCELMLRNYYNTSKNETLYIKKLDIIQEDMNIPKIEYDVYAKLSGDNLQKLNLSICKDIKVELLVPIKITESLDKLNISSGYYNDICYTSSTESGTDISLKDRQKENIEGNKAVCQDDCDFSDYDYNSQKAICLCEAKQSSNSFLDMNINKTKLYKNFIDIKNIANIKLMTCYKELFNKKSLIKNIAFFSIIPIIILHFITFILFYSGQKNMIKNKIKDISFGINNLDFVKEEEKNKIKIIKRKKKAIKIKKRNNNKKTKKFKNKNKNCLNKENNTIIQIPNPIDYYYFRNHVLKTENPPKRNFKINIYNKNNNNNININQNKNNQCSKKNRVNYDIEKEKTIKKVKEIMNYNEEEKNNLNYILALKYDKRTYWEYYISLIKTKHILFFSFYNNNDYNSKIIKIDLFFFSFAIYYAVNALFFNDNTMHKIYEDKGSFNFIYQLPQIIYSALISSVLNILLKLLALSQGNILDYKKNKNKKDLNEREKNLFGKLSIKFALFFIIGFLFLLFFWYYLSMFGAIYINTQLHLIKDTLISFGLSLLYPFGIYFLPGFFRIPALSNKKNKRIYLYNISKFLQML